MSDDAPLRYREHAPPPDLVREVECLWTLERGRPGAPARPHTILPDGCTDIIVSLAGTPPTTGDGAPGPASRVVGTMTTAATVEHAGRVRLVGVRFHPGGAAPFFGTPAGELADAVLPLDDLWGRKAETLRERMLEASGAEEAVAVMARVLPRHRSATALEADCEVLEAGRLLARRGGRVRIPELAGAVGLSPRQLLRRFRAAVGVSPKAAARIVRFRQAARRIRAEPGTPLARIALEAGYADQAHLTREFTALSGRAPGAHRHAGRA